MVEELYYPSSKNKGADQLRSHSAPLFWPLFSPRQIVDFPMWRLIYIYGPQREKMYLRTIFCLLENQFYFESILFLASNNLYLT